MQQLRGHGDSEIESLLTQIIPLYLTYGVVFGAGATLTYTPSLAIIGHYFKRHIGLANGLVAAGSSVFSIVMPLVLQVLLDEIGVGKRIYEVALLRPMFNKMPVKLDQDSKRYFLTFPAAKHAAVPGRHDRHTHRMRPKLQTAYAEADDAPGRGEEELRGADRPRRQLEEQEICYLGALRALGPLRLLCSLRAYGRSRKIGSTLRNDSICL